MKTTIKNYRVAILADIRIIILGLQKLRVGSISIGKTKEHNRETRNKNTYVEI